ncbi:hypothetical protein ACFS7Z_07235 [Pontibacter toksunensis]|uniref:Outer membrane protein beta-barrel domain-containing protein n=1 Tax=Pontibacter toksunensis TaxID=1332631 RepID=A0ABW6BSU7_9BACT
MKQHFFLLLLLLLLSTLSFAQINYKEGFVVTANGDTLRGFIDYREWDLTPGEVSFRTSATSGTAQVFNPSNTRYFEITGMEAYRSYEGPISMDKVNKDDLTYGKADTITLISRVFLEKRQDGPNVALYSYKDSVKERFFILEKGESRPRELSYKRYLLATNNAKVVEQRYYVGQLLNVARQQGTLTDKLQQEIEATGYKEQDLLRVISKLNGLSNEEIELDRKSRIGTAYFAGLALSRGTIKTYGADHFADADENPASYMPRLAFGLDVFLNKNVQKTFLRLEAGLTNASYSLMKREQTGNTSYHELSYEVTQQTLSLSPQIIYSLYNKENLKVHAGGGLAFNYSNYSRNRYRNQYFSPTYNYQRPPTEKDSYNALLSFWGTYTIRAGVIVNKKYEISAMYLAPGTITKYVSREVKTGSMNLGIYYLFRDR